MQEVPETATAGINTQTHLHMCSHTSHTRLHIFTCTAGERQNNFNLTWLTELSIHMHPLPTPLLSLWDVDTKMCLLVCWFVHAWVCTVSFSLYKHVACDVKSYTHTHTHRPTHTNLRQIWGNARGKTSVILNPMNSHGQPQQVLMTKHFDTDYSLYAYVVFSL